MIEIARYRQNSAVKTSILQGKNLFHGKYAISLETRKSLINNSVRGLYYFMKKKYTKYKKQDRDEKLKLLKHGVGEEHENFSGYS